MQSAFTKKMQGLSKEADAQRQAIEAYNAFMADPVGNAQRVLQQYGGPQQPAQNGGAGGQAAEEWQPQTWNEVIARAKEEGATEAERRIMERLSPYLQNVQELRKQTVEQQLSQIDPEWMKYEDGMKKTMKEHPTMVNDVGLLYRSSVPSEVLENQATQRALRIFEKKGKAAQVSGTTTVPHTESGAPKQAKNFNEAVKQAKAILAKKEI
jgi:hypothetical protein